MCPGLSRSHRFIDNNLVNEFGEHHIGHFGGVFVLPYQGNEMLNIKGLCPFLRNGGFQLVHFGFKVCLFSVILHRKLLVLPFGEQTGHEVFIQPPHKSGKLVISGLQPLQFLLALLGLRFLLVGPQGLKFRRKRFLVLQDKP